MADLITSTRAKLNIGQATYTTDENTTISNLITAVTKAISKYCKRNFDSQTYDELYNGSQSDQLFLRHFPIISVTRIAYGPTTVLTVKNTNTTTNQRATAAATSTGLSLTRVASGSSSTDTSVIWATSATLTAVATAVTALGNGWTSSVSQSAFNLRASADIRAIQGAMNALNVDAEFKIHVNELSGYDMDPNTGRLFLGVQQLDGFTNDGRLWTPGLNYWRIIYVAGYSTVPEDVQEAAAQWTAALYFGTKRDPGLAQEQIPSLVSRSPMHDMPETAKKLLRPYRDHKILTL